MAPTSKLNANGVEIGVIGETMGENAYLSLTDIARYKNPDEPKAVVATFFTKYRSCDTKISVPL